MICKKFSIYPKSPNCTNDKKSPKYATSSVATKAGVTAIEQLSFGTFLSRSCVGFMTFATPIRYGCAIAGITSIEAPVKLQTPVIEMNRFHSQVVSSPPPLPYQAKPHIP